MGSGCGTILLLLNLADPVTSLNICDDMISHDMMTGYAR